MTTRSPTERSSTPRWSTPRWSTNGSSRQRSSTPRSWTDTAVGSGMTDVTPALIDGEDLLSSQVSEVRSPYDGSSVGAVPACTEADLDRAVAVALARHRSGPPPAHERAAILDRAARCCSTDSTSSPNRSHARPRSRSRRPGSRPSVRSTPSASQPRSPVPSPARWWRWTPARPASASWVRHAGAGGCGRRHLSVQLPLNLVCHKIAPAVAAAVRWCSSPPRPLP